MTSSVVIVKRGGTFFGSSSSEDETPEVPSKQKMWPFIVLTGLGICTLICVIIRLCCRVVVGVPGPATAEVSKETSEKDEFPGDFHSTSLTHSKDGNVCVDSLDLEANRKKINNGGGQFLSKDLSTIPLGLNHLDDKQLYDNIGFKLGHVFYNAPVEEFIEALLVMINERLRGFEDSVPDNRCRICLSIFQPMGKEYIENVDFAKVAKIRHMSLQCQGTGSVRKLVEAANVVTFEDLDEPLPVSPAAEDIRVLLQSCTYREQVLRKVFFSMDCVFPVDSDFELRLGHTNSTINLEKAISWSHGGLSGLLNKKDNIDHGYNEAYIDYSDDSWIEKASRKQSNTKECKLCKSSHVDGLRRVHVMYDCPALATARGAFAKDNPRVYEHFKNIVGRNEDPRAEIQSCEKNPPEIFEYVSIILY